MKDILKPGMGQLPERFEHGPHTKAMTEYIFRRWGKSGFQRLKSIGYNQEWEPEWNKSDRYRWVEHPNTGLRFVGKVHAIRMDGTGNQPYIDRSIVDHTGWYMDDFHDSSETAWGVVYQLPGRGGKPRYIPGICDYMNDKSGNDCAILDFRSITDDIREAIRWADGMAESYAESEREYQEKQRREDRVEEIKEELGQNRDELRELARTCREHCSTISGIGPVRKAVEDQIFRIKKEIQKLRKEKEALA